MYGPQVGTIYNNEFYVKRWMDINGNMKIYFKSPSGATEGYVKGSDYILGSQSQYGQLGRASWDYKDFSLYPNYGSNSWNFNTNEALFKVILLTKIYGSNERHYTTMQAGDQFITPWNMVDEPYPYIWKIRMYGKVGQTWTKVNSEEYGYVNTGIKEHSMESNINLKKIHAGLLTCYNMYGVKVGDTVHTV